MNKISVIVDDSKSQTQTGTLRDGGLLKPSVPAEIETGVLRDSFSKLSGQISEILQDVKSVGDFRLQQVQLAVEISAEGGVSLIGSAKAGAKGSIMLTFGV